MLALTSSLLSSFCIAALTPSFFGVRCKLTCRPSSQVRCLFHENTRSHDHFRIDRGHRSAGATNAGVGSGITADRADVVADAALLDWARRTAPRMLDQTPELAEKHVQRWLGTKAEFLKA